MHQAAKRRDEANALIKFDCSGIREFGSHHKIVDLLDERSLSLAEIRQFVVYLLGAHVEDKLPHPEAEPATFRSAAEALMEREEL